jgi:hypothetical protein
VKPGCSPRETRDVLGNDAVTDVTATTQLIARNEIASELGRTDEREQIKLVSLTLAYYFA